MRELLLSVTTLMALLLTGCTNETAVLSPDEGSLAGRHDSVAVGLGTSLQKAYKAATRMSATGTQYNGNFRGITDFFLIPYATQGTIGPDDVPLKPNVELGRMLTSSQLISNSEVSFAYYHPVYIPRNTGSFLIYGHAPAGTSPFTYGSLTGFDNITSQTKASDITFSPDQIYTATGVPSVAEELASYLTSIATVQYVLPTAFYGNIFYRVQRTPIYRWSNPDSHGSAALSEAFELLANEDRVTCGASQQINRLLTKLYNGLYAIANYDPTTIDYYADASVTNPDGTVYPYRELATAIRAAIANTDYVIVDGSGNNVNIILKTPRHDFPTGIDLPEGAAGLQWNASSQEFQVVMQTKASAKVMSASRFCYPPLLCYYANSPIKTSDVDDEKEHYVSTNSWQQILDEYNSASAYVNSNTKSVVIRDNINYGVARFQIRMERVTSLRDRGDEHEFVVNGSNFPLTGLIVGPQHEVAYNFDPLQSSDDYMVYDREIEDEDGNNVYLMPYADPVIQTLVLPTRKDEEVYFVLEFENRSGESFNGANGLILNGSKFYMMAKLDPKDATGYDADDLVKNRVFAQDCYTQVNCKVKDLKGAWNVVPDTRDPQLEVGISMETKWTQSSTTNFRLD